MIKELIITQALMFFWQAAGAESFKDWAEYGLGALVIAALFFFVVKPVVAAFTDNIKTTGKAIDKLTDKQQETIDTVNRIETILKN